MLAAICTSVLWYNRKVLSVSRCTAQKDKHFTLTLLKSTLNTVKNFDSERQNFQTRHFIILQLAWIKLLKFTFHSALIQVGAFFIELEADIRLSCNLNVAEAHKNETSFAFIGAGKAISGLENSKTKYVKLSDSQNCT